MAVKWEGFLRNKERYPNLKYRTVGDEHVRDDHEKLDGLIAAIDDPIWDKIYPPNDWRCRCSVSQTNASITPEDDRPDIGFMKPEFEINVGKTGVVFNEKAHPYYIIPKKDQYRVRLAFESMKLRLKYGKAKYISTNGSKVFIHPFADSNDLLSNFSNAVIMANRLNTTVKIRPHVDSTFLKGYKNYEYEIGKEAADLKSIQGYRGILTGLNTAKTQGATTVVFNLDAISGLDTQEVYRRLKGNITPKRKKSIKRIILIYGEKAVSIKRKQIIDDEFKQLLEKLKS